MGGLTPGRKSGRRWLACLWKLQEAGEEFPPQRTYLRGFVTREYLGHWRLGVSILLVSLLPSGLSIFCLHGSSGALGLTNSGSSSH